MNVETAIEKLEAEWDRIEANGFFEQLRMGNFDADGFERVWNILDSLEIPEGDCLNRRFGEVVWFMPTFMHWQSECWRQDGKDCQQLDKATNKIEQRLTTILGLP